MKTSRTRIFTLKSLLLALFGALIIAGLSLGTVRAVAVFQNITETGKPGYLVLSLDSSTSLWATLDPGDSTHWLIRATLNDAAESTLAVELLGSGSLVTFSGLEARIDSCDTSFDPQTLVCSGLHTAVLPQKSIKDLPVQGNKITLATLHSAAPREFLVTLTLPADAQFDSTETATATIGLGVHATGSSGKTDNDAPQKGELPTTGADYLALGLLATGIIGLGLMFAARNREAS